MNRERNLSFRSTVVAPEISTKATLVLLKYRLCGSKFSDHELQTIIKGATKSNLPKPKQNFCTKPKYLRLNEASNRMQDATEIRET